MNDLTGRSNTHGSLHARLPLKKPEHVPSVGRNPAQYPSGFIHPRWCRISSINSSLGLSFFPDDFDSRLLWDFPKFLGHRQISGLQVRFVGHGPKTIPSLLSR